MVILATESVGRFQRQNNQRQFHCGRCSMKTVPSKSMCCNAPAARAGYGFSPRFIRQMPPQKSWNGSVCPPAPHLWPPPLRQIRSPSNGPEDRCEPLKRPTPDSCAFNPLVSGIRTSHGPNFAIGTRRRLHKTAYSDFLRSPKSLKMPLLCWTPPLIPLMRPISFTLTPTWISRLH